MKKILLTLFLLLLLSSTVHAQNTNVSATVTDAGGQAWNNGTYTFNFVPAPRFNGTYQLNGSPYTPTSISGTLSSSASLTSIAVPNNALITPSGTQWSVTVCPQGSGSCFISLPITITGASQTITSSLIPPVIVVSCGNGVTAYADTEVQCGIGGQYYNLTTQTTRICQASSGNTCSTWSSSSGGGGASVGPVINAQSPSTYGGTVGASTSVNDNATAFGQLATGVNAAAFVSQGGIAFKNQCVAQSAATTSLSCNIAIAPNDTILVFLADNHPTGQTITVSDTGGNLYFLLNAEFAAGGGEMYTFASVPRVQNSATSVIVSDSPSEVLSMTVVSYTGVGGYSTRGVTPNSNAGSTAPTVSKSTLDNNNVLVGGVAWTNGSTISLSANVGNVRANQAATATTFGGAAIDNTSATPASITVSGTLSASSPWGVQKVELRSGIPAVPSVYLPYGPGAYNYTSGLNFLFPFSFRGEGRGSCLNYLGSAHALDLGPTTLTNTTYQQDEYTIEKLCFTGGWNQTEGIFINPLLLKISLLHNTFFNFGNAVATEYAVFSNGENDDLLEEGNFIYDTDLVPRKHLSTNHNATQLRVLNNVAVCSTGFGATCNSTQGGVLYTTAGADALFSENNLAFYCPNILMVDTANGGVGYNTRVVNNYFEGATSCNAMIQFQNQDGIHIEENFFNMANLSFPIAATSGKTAVNMLVAHNYAINMPAATELVALNNLTGQTGNLDFGNMCATGAGSGTAPCPKVHTIGGNINQWNADYAGTCTMNGSTGCPAYSFLGTYNAAPKCTASWTGSGTLAGHLVLTITTSAFTITSSTSTDTAVVNWACSPEAQ